NQAPPGRGPWFGCWLTAGNTTPAAPTSDNLIVRSTATTGPTVVLWEGFVLGVSKFTNHSRRRPGSRPVSSSPGRLRLHPPIMRHSPVLGPGDGLPSRADERFDALA